MTNSIHPSIRHVLPRILASAAIIWIGAGAFRMISALGSAPPPQSMGKPTIDDGVVPLSVDGTWRFVKASQTPHLLPLDDSNRLCGRWTPEKQMVAELVALNDPARNLLDQWRSAGWQVRHTLWGDPYSFSYLCVKDGTIVYAWSAQRGRIKQLLLSRTSDVGVSAQRAIVTKPDFVSR